MSAAQIPWGLLGQRLHAFERITAMLKPGCVIVETGTVRFAGNWGGDGQSTVVWNAYAELLGGHVTTIDLDPVGAELVEQMGLANTTAITGDSLEVLPTLTVSQIDFLYLDSFDVDWNNTTPAAEHHLAELKIVWPLLKPGSIVAVDDNRNGHGKGELVAAHMAANDVPEILNEYVRVWKVPQ
jgi:predicted O-methyltransferase YrrM